MKTESNWTMNCILAGARAFKLFQAGKHGDADWILANLTSEFDRKDVEYLLMRLNGILEGE